MKLTNEEKILRRKAKKPNPVLYTVLMVVPFLINKKLHTKFTYKEYPGKEEGPIILVSNHASRMDYAFTGPVCMPKKLNYVVGYNEFYNFPQNILLRLCHVIPKKNFVPDLHAVRQIVEIIKKGGSICIMPEGMSSITGMAQPVMPGGAKLFKKLGVPVYYTKISGGYMTYTKHCLDERAGKVEVVVDRMFTKEQLKELSVSQVEDTMNRLLAHDDYIWNSEKQNKFNGKGQMAKNLDTLLYMCPKCMSKYKMETSGNEMTCKSCGNSIIMDECYNIKAKDEKSICPPLVTDWTIMERKDATEEVSKENFSYTGHVKIGTLPKYGYLTGGNTSEITGEGDLKLDSNGLSFTGTKNGEPFSFEISSEKLPTFGMCTDISRFYTFATGEFIEFFPDKKDTLRWDHLTEQLHRKNGGEWKETEYRHND